MKSHEMHKYYYHILILQGHYHELTKAKHHIISYHAQDNIIHFIVVNKTKKPNRLDTVPEF